MIKVVEVTLSVKKNLRKIPLPIKKKLFTWVAAVEKKGLNEIRKIPGYHDEPLKGIDEDSVPYVLISNGGQFTVVIKKKIEFVLIEEVTPHDY